LSWRSAQVWALAEVADAAFYCLTTITPSSIVGPATMPDREPSLQAALVFHVSWSVERRSVGAAPGDRSQPVSFTKNDAAASSARAQAWAERH
jgi:hypothetical protein